MSDDALPDSEMILYQTEDGRTRIECRFENETLWLTQAQIAELFQVTVPTVNEHLKGIYAEGEVSATATIRKFRIVRLEGHREVARKIEHYRSDTEVSQQFFMKPQVASLREPQLPAPAPGVGQDLGADEALGLFFRRRVGLSVSPRRASSFLPDETPALPPGSDSGCGPSGAEPPRHAVSAVGYGALVQVSGEGVHDGRPRRQAR